MTIDDTLLQMLGAVDAKNFWDAEAYAQQALDYIDGGGELNENATQKDIEELRSFVVSVRDEANRMYKQERLKADLIEQIVNFKG